MGYSSTQHDQYRQSAINGASPLQLIVMLYDGALRFMNAGLTAMRQENRFEQNEKLTRAQRIVAELMSCLDMEKGGEVAQNLMALYSYTYDQLVQGNLQDDEQAVLRAQRVMSDLRGSWVALDKESKAATATTGNGITDAAA
ncbi:MAG: flagellar export chaperone FliS [Fimbriimonadaceae bacterium]|nr:flagellar export chaperone FliS [Fimbriimonadaceae bacterium]